MISVNARLLCIKKTDKLLYVVQMNDVSCVCVTETWFKGSLSSESVGLAGYSPYARIFQREAATIL